ncbi:hypothetical protein F4810DRAFT_651838 [Camillea tinctor]|nr:hypothetical protein F4810DRAFT_651838 [Camillea tinctor]
MMDPPALLSHSWYDLVLLLLTGYLAQVAKQATIFPPPQAPPLSPRQAVLGQEGGAQVNPILDSILLELTTSLGTQTKSSGILHTTNPQQTTTHHILVDIRFSCPIFSK